MNIEDLTPELELTRAEARSISGGMSRPVEEDGGIGGPANDPPPVTEDWYPSLPSMPELPALPTWPMIDPFGGQAPGKWW